MKPYTLICSSSLKRIAPIILASSIGLQVTLGQDVIPESAEESLQELGIESDFAEVSVIDLNNDSSIDTTTIQISTSPKPATSSNSAREALEIIGADAGDAEIKSVDTLRNSEIKDSPSKILSQETNRYRVPSEFLNEPSPLQDTDSNVTSDLGSVPTEFTPPDINIIDNPDSVAGSLELADPSLPSTSDATPSDSPSGPLNTSDEISKSISEELTTSEATEEASPIKAPVANSTTDDSDDSDATSSEDPQPKKKQADSDSDEELLFEDEVSESSPAPEIISSVNAPETISESLTQSNATFLVAKSSFLSSPANDPIGGLGAVSALAFELKDLPVSSSSNVPEPTTGLLLTLTLFGMLSRRIR